MRYASATHWRPQPCTSSPKSSHFAQKPVHFLQQPSNPHSHHYHHPPFVYLAGVISLSSTLSLSAHPFACVLTTTLPLLPPSLPSSSRSLRGSSKYRPPTPVPLSPSPSSSSPSSAILPCACTPSYPLVSHPSPNHSGLYRSTSRNKSCADISLSQALPPNRENE